MGFHPSIYRVDFESALVAALPRNSFHVVILDQKSTGLARATVEALMREHNVRVPLVELAPGRSLAEDVRSALVARRN